MSSKQVQRGEIISFVTAGAVAVDAPVVIGNLVGVALTAAAGAAETIEVAIAQVYNLPKVDAAVIAQGERVIFDVSANGGIGEVDDENATPAAGDVSNFGVAFEAKGATTGEDIAVLLTPGSGTVT